MKLGRIAVPTLDGEQIRVVAVEPEAEQVIDPLRATTRSQTRRRR